jgi:hypothetical protein
MAKKQKMIKNLLDGCMITKESIKEESKRKMRRENYGRNNRKRNEKARLAASTL